MYGNKLAVITGGSSGIGRELALQLAAAGCHLAICATSEAKLAETRRLCAEVADGEVRITTHSVDVSDESQVVRFREAVCEQHSTDHIHLLINNAGIAGDGSFVNSHREQWERIFNINWYGVYYSTCTFMPMLVASDEGHIVNMSSVSGLWAAQGAYSTSKFAVRGFTESLVPDLRRYAPHVKASVVIPGKVCTGLIAESQKHLGRDNSAELEASSRAFAESAPTTAVEAAAMILEGVRAERWRILVGVDAAELDQQVRETPEEVYDPDFIGRITSWR